MNTPDLINGLFEIIAGLFLLQNCWRLYKDKEVRGWSILSQAFFTSWSYWNCYYYPGLNQWLSFFSGILVCVANTLWTTMAIYYTRKNKKKQILHG